MRFLYSSLVALLLHTTALAQTGQAVVLRKLLIAPTEAGALAMRADKGGDSRVVVQDVPLLGGTEFPPVVLPFFGQPLNLESVNALAGAIKQYGVKNDRLINIVIPDQPREDVAAGVIRLAVIVNRYNALEVKGNRWFSSKLLRDKLGIKSGDEIRLSLLEEAVDWTNNNPFRHVKVLLNNASTQPGATDLIIGVEERLPLRLAASVDDSGVPLLGRMHYTGSLQYANLWGLDHQISYQFTTGDHNGVFRAHGADYRIPLPWRHHLQLAGSFAEIHPSFENGLFSLTGKNWVGDLRYIVPLEKRGWSCEFSAGIDFKRSNNNLEYGGYQLPGAEIDVWQASLGATFLRRNPKGVWSFAFMLNASPGNLDRRNTDEMFGGQRLGAKARYVTGTVQVQRLTKLPADCQFFTRAQVQMASGNLVGSEQMSIGGQATVRGYNERISSGDQGWALTNELHGPQWSKPLRFLPKNTPPLQSRLLAFWELARVSYKHTTSNDITLDPLMSVGLGLRGNIGSYLTLSADYGWQLRRTERPQSETNRGHVRLTFAY